MGHPIGRVWARLNDPAPFLEGQIRPHRVEFVGGGFEPGVLNAHHGPLLNAEGAVGRVHGIWEEPAYRHLGYFHGSYTMSPCLTHPPGCDSVRRGGGRWGPQVGDQKPVANTPVLERTSRRLL